MIRHTGFTLIVALILMAVMLSFGTTLSSLAFKQHLIANASTESQYAFYAADSALECALYADQKNDQFNYAAFNPTNTSAHPAPIECNGNYGTEVSYLYVSTNPGSLTQLQRLSITSGLCADVLVQKNQNNSTTIYAQGYDVACSVINSGSAAPFVSRGLSTSY